MLTLKPMDRKILEELDAEGSIEGTKDQDAVGELIDLCDDFNTSQAGEIRDRLDILLSNDLIRKRTAGRRKWAEIFIADTGRAALAQPAEEDDAEHSSGTEGSPANERGEVEKLQDRVRDHLHGVREALEDAVSVASSALDERDKAVARAEAAELRAEAAEARLTNLRAGLTEVLESDEDTEGA